MNISNVSTTLILYLQRGWVPLYIASGNGQEDVVNLLLKSGAGVNHQTLKVVNDVVHAPPVLASIPCA